ncbi:ecto-ADP-ribosyltransferase 5-like [Salvelinus alpinus]
MGCECENKKRWLVGVFGSLVLIILLIVCLYYTVFKPFTLDMAPDSVDDKYDGCTTEMYTKAAKYLQEERNSNSKFNEAWKIAEQKAKSPKYGLYREHSIAMYLYTNNKPKTKSKSQSFYFDFNKAVRNGKSLYGKTFQYHSLHFYLTDAIHILKLSQTTCRTTYRRTGTYFDQSVVDKEIRFGSFTSSSQLKTLYTFGNVSCFEIKTCFGANLTYYSAYANESEVLIPPYEVFKVTEVQKNQWCEVVYKVESTRSQSNLNCRLLNGVQSNQRGSFFPFSRISDKPAGFIMLYFMFIFTVYY